MGGGGPECVAEHGHGDSDDGPRTEILVQIVQRRLISTGSASPNDHLETTSPQRSIEESYGLPIAPSGCSQGLLTIGQ